MLRVVSYARVSARGQKSIPDQLAGLRRLAELKEWEIVGEYSEKETGKRDTRPVRQEILKLAWRREIDVIMVYKLDRWGRNMLDLVSTLMDLQAHDCAFVSQSEGLDLTTPTGRLMVHILSAFAEFEREQIVDRIKTGIKHRRERGERIGRLPTARWKSDQVLALDAEGKNHSEIARACKISRASVIRILRSSGKE